VESKLAIDPKLMESFNNIKNRIYKNNNFVSRYDFQELAEILTRNDWNNEEIEALKRVKDYVNNIKNCVEDLGSKIIDISIMDFSNKIRLGDFIKEIIVIIDEFIDSLSAIINVIEFEENRINVDMSLARLKSLRNSLIQKINEYTRMTSGVTFSDDNINFMHVLVNDIIDSIIKESFKLRIQKLSEILNSKF